MQRDALFGTPARPRSKAPRGQPTQSSNAFPQRTFAAIGFLFLIGGFVNLYYLSGTPTLSASADRADALEVGPGRHCSPSHPTHFGLLFRELDGTL
jgi:hypothetical protein